MLAADKLLLQSNVKQRAIQLREKELNLFNDKCAAATAATAQPPQLPCSPECARVPASMQLERRVPCSRASR